jgi:hypothetical protein
VQHHGVVNSGILDLVFIAFWNQTHLYIEMLQKNKGKESFEDCSKQNNSNK